METAKALVKALRSQHRDSYVEDMETLANATTKELQKELRRRMLDSTPLEELEAAVTRKRRIKAAHEHSAFLEFAVQHTGLSREAILSPRRPRHVARARKIAMVAMRESVDCPLVEIAKTFGRAEHGTISHATQSVAQSPELRAEVERMKRAWSLSKMRREATGHEN